MGRSGGLDSDPIRERWAAAVTDEVMDELYEARELHDLRELCAGDRVAAMSLAHEAVADAIRSGLLVPVDACESCGARPRRIAVRRSTSSRRRSRSMRATVFHHDGRPDPYSPENFLVGRWLCRRCHGRAHADDERERPDAL